jgi:predicted MPP superfamily phosphohydrolase
MTVPLRLSRARTLVPLAGLLAGFLSGTWGFGLEPSWLEGARHRVMAPVDPPLVIAHLSDLHVRRLGRREESLLALLAREKPDAIVITGDSPVDGDVLVPDRERDDDYAYARVGELLDRLHAPLGVWAVRGNWENERRPRDERAYYEAHGVRLLVNEARELRAGVWVAGVDDPEGAPDVEAALRSIPEGAFAVGLFHSPALFDAVAGRLPLSLAGHTHGGQVRPPFVRPFWLPKWSGRYLEGWYEGQRGSRLYVSRGIGTSFLPVRFLCRPELAIVTLGR